MERVFRSPYTRYGYGALSGDVIASEIATMEYVRGVVRFRFRGFIRMGEFGLSLN